MEYVYASLLLHTAGKEISEAKIGSILKAAGVDVNQAQIKSIVAALDGVNIDDAIKSAVMPAVAIAAPASGETKKEEKKEVEEEKKEEEVAGLGALFG